ncbi:hypothetical protein GCM10010182_45970 [Actinomadura cremea]|nr:hypothetical protein GCM10010182_45970 [Actinomadura cremea]
MAYLVGKKLLFVHPGEQGQRLAESPTRESPHRGAGDRTEIHWPPQRCRVAVVEETSAHLTAKPSRLLTQVRARIPLPEPGPVLNGFGGGRPTRARMSEGAKG